MALFRRGCEDLRKQSAAEITSLPFDGFAIGGPVGWGTAAIMYEILEHTTQYMPVNKAQISYGSRHSLTVCGRRCRG